MIILRQKSFGWIRNKLVSSIRKDYEVLPKQLLKSRERDRVINKDIEEKLISNNLDVAEVVRSEDGETKMEYPSKSRASNIRKALSEENDFSEDDIKLLSLVMLRDDRNIFTIYWNRSSGLEELAHEFGHVKNYRGSLLDSFISKGARFSNKVRALPDGVVNSVLDVLSSPLLIAEERNASNKGYKLLEKYGLPPKDLKLAKESLDAALEIYKTQSRISWKRKLINSKIPQWLL